jgi:hypothetical protein
LDARGVHTPPWSTPLGIAVILFLLAGFFHVLIGALTPVSIRQAWAPGILIYTGEADAAIFGKPATELRQDPDVMKLREITLGMISGLLVGIGLLEMAIAWFGLRPGNAWALAALIVSQAAMIAFWIVGHRLWIQAGMPGGLGALQPYQHVPAFLSLPAAVLAWWGLRGP